MREIVGTEFRRKGGAKFAADSADHSYATLPEVGIRPRTTNHTFFYDHIRHSRLLSLLPTYI